MAEAFGGIGMGNDVGSSTEVTMTTTLALNESTCIQQVKRRRRSSVDWNCTPLPGPASIEVSRQRDLTPATQRSFISWCGSRKALIWNCPELSAGSTRRMLVKYTGMKGKDFRLKRVVQPDGIRRFDLYPVGGDADFTRVDWPRVEEALLARIRPDIPAILRGDPLVPKPFKRLGESMPFSAVTFNVCGLWRKRIEICMLVEKLGSTVVALQETRRIPGSRTYIPRYQVIETRVDKMNRGNGVLLGVRRESGLALTEYDSTPWFISGLAEGISLGSKKISMLIYSVYIPCRGTSFRSEALMTLRESVVRAWEKDKHTHIVLLGDFNSPPEELRKYLDTIGLGLELHQPDVFTRESGNRKSILDYIVTKGLEGNSHMRVLNGIDISDHFPLMGLWAWEDPPEYCPKESINPLALEQMADAVRSSAKWNEITEAGCVEDAIAALNKVSWEVSRQLDAVTVPKSPKWGRFITNRSLALIRARRAMFKLRATERFDEEVYKRLWAESKQSLKQDMQKERAAKLRDLCRAWQENRGRELWAKLRLLLGLQSSGIMDKPLYDRTDKVFRHTEKEKAKIWARHFGELAKTAGGHSRDKKYWQGVMPEAERVPVREGCDDPITWAEICAALKAMPRGKAAGIDGVPGELYKLIQAENTPSSCLAIALNSVVTSLWETARVPEALATAVVVPIPKKGDLSDPDNYRGISLIPVILKVISKIATARLNHILERDGVLMKEQAGFRTMEECVAQATALYEAVKRRMNLGKRTYALFIDFAKAYDKVPQEGMLRKLRQAGVGGHLHRVISGLYENPKMCVRTGKRLSEQVEYLCGVRQGCPASPILFDLYINDILEGINGISVPGVLEPMRGLLFADDAVVFAETTEELQEAADGLYHWAQKWEMKINVRKCGVLLFSDEEHPRNDCEVKISDEPVPNVDSYTYLGVALDGKLSRECMVKGIVGKGIKTCESLRKVLAERTYPINLKLLLYNAKLVPVLTYGAELWGMKSKVAEPLQRVANTALKTMVRCGKGVSLGRLRDELGVEGIDKIAASKRARAIEKFPMLKTWIKVLMDSKPTGRKNTWVSTGKRWLKTFVGERTADAGVKRRLGEVFSLRASRKDKTLATSWAKDLGLAGGNPQWIRLSAVYPSLSAYLAEIGRMRIGVFPTAKRLAYARCLNESFRRRCPCCEMNKAETLEHLLLECPRWEEARERYIWRLLDKEACLMSSAAATRAVGVLLEGEPGTGLVLDGVKRLRLTDGIRANNLQKGELSGEIVISTARFLAELVPTRWSIVAPKLRGKRLGSSFRNQGQVGTVALGGP